MSEAEKTVEQLYEFTCQHINPNYGICKQCAIEALRTERQRAIKAEAELAEYQAEHQRLYAQWQEQLASARAEREAALDDKFELLKWIEGYKHQIAGCDQQRARAEAAEKELAEIRSIAITKEGLDRKQWDSISAMTVAITIRTLMEDFKKLETKLRAAEKERDEWKEKRDALYLQHSGAVLRAEKAEALLDEAVKVMRPIKTKDGLTLPPDREAIEDFLKRVGGKGAGHGK